MAVGGHTHTHRPLSRLAPSVTFVVALVASMAGLAYAMRDLPVGTSYAVWVGIGATLTVAYAMATGTEVLVSRLFWGLGYHVPETHLATLRSEDLRIDDEARIDPCGPVRGPGGARGRLPPALDGAAGPFVAGAPSATFNDRLIFLTAADVMPALEMRVPKPPTVATGENGSFLAYELHVTSFTGQPVAVKRIDVAICAAVQPIAAAASWAVRVLDGIWTTRKEAPCAARASCTRAALAGGTTMVVDFCLPGTWPVCGAASLPAVSSQQRWPLCYIFCWAIAYMIPIASMIRYCGICGLRW